jgi:Ni,Fe-hydrogenase III large subunit
MKTDFTAIRHGQAVSMEQVPLLAWDDFYKQARALIGQGAKVVHYFVYADGPTLKLLAVLRTEWLLAAAAPVPEHYPSLTPAREPLHLFEREIAEQYAIRPEGHPWFKMVRYHPNARGVADLFGNDYRQDIPGNYPYYTVHGEEIHEVAVGPVHAGVIEPGHFRFNCIGERVLHLEIQLGYQHRGVEPLLVQADHRRRPLIVESIAGDTAVGHGLCHAQAMEALAGITPDDGARRIRSLALELERIANHVGDLGALSGDVAFLPPANYCGRMRGDFLNMTLLLCGNRFGKGLVRPGGVQFDLSEAIRTELRRRLAELKPQVLHVMDLLFATPSVRARFEGCGVVSLAEADNLGLVGPCARASGLAYDARRLFASEAYTELSIPKYAESSGDVFARAKVRAMEVRQSLELVDTLLARPVETRRLETSEAPALKPSACVVTVNEGWRGEIAHCVITDAAGKILRYKVKDPSFHNWNGLAMALRNTGISDFPLNNKSFNLSYCGFDL